LQTETIETGEDYPGRQGNIEQISELFWEIKKLPLAGSGVIGGPGGFREHV
jgi:hypothetical protein